MKLAAVTLALSGILHFVVILFGAPITMAVFGAAYLALAYALSKEIRAVGWIVFLLMLVFMSAALGYAFSGGALGMVFAAITLLDVVTAIVLFVVLWNKPEEPVSL